MVGKLLRHNMVSPMVIRHQRSRVSYKCLHISTKGTLRSYAYDVTWCTVRAYIDAYSITIENIRITIRRKMNHTPHPDRRVPYQLPHNHTIYFLGC